jgi:hypothetical protein
LRNKGLPSFRIDSCDEQNLTFCSLFFHRVRRIFYILGQDSVL